LRYRDQGDNYLKVENAMSAPEKYRFFGAAACFAVALGTILVWIPPRVREIVAVVAILLVSFGMFFWSFVGRMQQSPAWIRMNLRLGSFATLTWVILKWLNYFHHPPLPAHLTDRFERLEGLIAGIAVGVLLPLVLSDDFRRATTIRQTKRSISDKVIQ
jgi:hypothetical protein